MVTPDVSAEGQDPQCPERSDATATQAGGPLQGRGANRDRIRPRDIDRAFFLSLGELAVNTVLMAIWFLRPGGVFEHIRALVGPLHGWNDEQALSGYAVSVAFAVMPYIVVVYIRVLFLMKMRAGRNWARILLTVLGVLAIVYCAVLLPQLTFVVSAFEVLAAALTLSAIVLIFRPAANAYFAATRQLRPIRK